ncbi:MAG: type IV secretion system protein VirD4 [Rickettsiales bacterium]|nr:type IV secretion system protein VirD4 [Rickettsiales bacterium]
MSSKNNILLGLDAYNKKLFVENNDYRHILLIAPHGSGKGVCFVIPSLLAFEESAIVHDIKMENYELTGGYRASIGHKIFMWNPLGEKDKTSRYNPLDFISSDPIKIIDDIQKISHLLIRDRSDYMACAKNLFTSIVLYLGANTAKTKSFGEIARILSGDLIAELSNAVKKSKNDLHPFAISQIKSFLSKDKHEQNSIIRVLSSYLAPWNNPLIDHATSKSDFDIADFKKNKTTLYVGLNPTDIDRLQPVMQFFYDHALERLATTAGELGYNDKNGGVCLFMDEFYSLGKLEMMAAASYFRGYKIKLFLITADIESIENIYGENGASAIISDCATKIFFAAKSFKTANKISQICLDKSKNLELISWQEAMNLAPDSQIITRDHEQPIISKKVFYYEDEEMKKKIIAL